MKNIRNKTTAICTTTLLLLAIAPAYATLPTLHAAACVYAASDGAAKCSFTIKQIKNPNFEKMYLQPALDVIEKSHSIYANTTSFAVYLDVGHSKYGYNTKDQYDIQKALDEFTLTINWDNYTSGGSLEKATAITCNYAMLMYGRCHSDKKHQGKLKSITINDSANPLPGDLKVDINFATSQSARPDAITSSQKTVTCK